MSTRRPPGASARRAQPRLTLEPSESARRLEIDTVGQVMSHPAVTIDESTPLSAALHLFREGGLR